MIKTFNERVYDNVCVVICRMIRVSKIFLFFNQVSEIVFMLSFRFMYFLNFVIKFRVLINLIYVKQNCGYCINSKFLCVFVYILVLYVLDFGFQVLLFVLQCLFLKEDFEENKIVFDCLCQLYLSGE